jgi:hypothetical protein
MTDYEIFSSEFSMINGELYRIRFCGAECMPRKLKQTLSVHGYKRTYAFGRRYLQHRIVLLLSNGEWPKEHTDHINGDRSDNRICNLRPVTQSENNKNTTLRKNNTGYFGIRRLGPNSWRAKIGNKDARVANGRAAYFNNLADAIAWRKAKEIEYGYHENHGRTA